MDLQPTFGAYDVLSICDRTGNMVRPWAQAGHRCLCLDLAHSIRSDRTEEVEGGGVIVYRWADVRAVTPGELDVKPVVVFAFPPCTNLAVSGARDFARKGLRGLIDALELIESCRMLCQWWGVPWMLENPVSRLSTCWRKPDHTFQPWQYGDNYTKRTCLWTGGGFVLPPPTVEQEPDDVQQTIWKMPPGPDRADKRAETPAGFAAAVFRTLSEKPG